MTQKPIEFNNFLETNIGVSDVGACSLLGSDKPGKFVSRRDLSSESSQTIFIQSTSQLSPGSAKHCTVLHYEVVEPQSLLVL